MNFATIRVRAGDGRRTITFARKDRRNGFNSRMLEELGRALQDCALDPSCRMVVLEGEGGYFSTGLDFEDASKGGAPQSSQGYVDVLRAICTLPAFVVAHVDGEVRAGGLGFVAASDFAVATARSTFALPEALWGLVPACVGLYVERRIGPIATKRMCLTTETLMAAKAFELGLVDEISEKPEDVVRRLGLKVARLKSSTMGRIKRYFDEIAGISELQERRAMVETDRAMRDPEVQDAISNFVHHGKFPWGSSV